MNKVGMVSTLWERLLRAGSSPDRKGRDRQVRWMLRDQQGGTQRLGGLWGSLGLPPPPTLACGTPPSPQEAMSSVALSTRAAGLPRAVQTRARNLWVTFRGAGRMADQQINLEGGRDEWEMRRGEGGREYRGTRLSKKNSVSNQCFYQVNFNSVLTLGFGHKEERRAGSSLGL